MGLALTWDVATDCKEDVNPKILAYPKACCNSYTTYMSVVDRQLVMKRVDIPKGGRRKPITKIKPV